MNDDLDLEWDEQLALSSWKPPLELQEDVYYHFMSLNPTLKEIMDKWDLELET